MFIVYSTKQAGNFHHYLLCCNKLVRSLNHIFLLEYEIIYFLQVAGKFLNSIYNGILLGLQDSMVTLCNAPNMLRLCITQQAD